MTQPPNVNESRVSKMNKTEPECVLTGVGDTSSPTQAVKTDWGALGEAVGLEGHPLEEPNRPQCDSGISLWE